MIRSGECGRSLTNRESSPYIRTHFLALLADGVGDCRVFVGGSGD